MAEQGLKARIIEDMKSAMRARDKPRLATIRLITSAIKQIEVDERIELDDARVLSVLEKMIKQRRDSIEQFEKAARTDLSDREKAEVVIIQEYMPAALSEEELEVILNQVISDTGASSMKDMGKVMGALKPRVAGRADMGALSAKIKARLNS
ncbi:MAG: CBU_1594 family Dot/Icm type IV secretion system effector [Gammaproteobacteria bacterium]|nr:MAG: CBU_1594 family Dot/Icm type IV secretion system effector [Gammaproteobacteria bacterium]